MVKNMEEQVLDNYRKEIKFELPKYNLDRIYNDCLEVGFIREFPNRKVESIYFDDIFNTFLEDSINGLLERKKIRLRRYNDSNTGQLEEKVKNNHLNKKLITPIKFVPNFSNYDELLKFIRDFYPEKNLIPAASISYSRIYLKNKKSNVRITLDFQIETQEFQTNIFKELFNSFILEIKCNSDAELPMLDFGPQIRFSKYCFSRQNE
ncbi:MAG: hypothetical protein RL422_99 [Bacteroidota bacterium]|jgi:hypothetical protein